MVSQRIKFAPSCRTEYIERIEISHVYMLIYIYMYIWVGADKFKICESNYKRGICRV